MEQACTVTPRAKRSKVGALVPPAGAERSYDMYILRDDLASTWTKPTTPPTN